MLRTGSRTRAFATATAALMLTSALCACNKNGGPDAAPSDSGSAEAEAAPVAVPLSTTTPATLASAPPVTALPAGQAVQMAPQSDRSEGYRYLDRATYQENAVEDAPPDYSFEQGEVRPWTWATSDGARVICEPVAGGYRTYYYNAGSDTPYLVRDPQYAYAYDNGALIGVYTLAGVLIDLNTDPNAMEYASRYRDRGHALWGNASSGLHLPVNAYAWSDRRADLSAQRVAWQRNIANNPDWAAWNGAHRDEEQGHWDEVRQQHEQAAQQFGTWQQQRFQGPPPQLYAQPGERAAQPNHTAAIVGGVVAGGIAATAAHAVLGHHDAPHPMMGPAAVPPAAQHPGAVEPGRKPGYEHAQAPAAPGYAAHPAHPAHPVEAAPPHVDQRRTEHAPHPVEAAPPHVNQPRPEHVATPQAPHPAPRAAEHPAPHPVQQPAHAAAPEHAPRHDDPHHDH